MAKIVVGIDGSEHSRAALRWALHEARLRQVGVLAHHAYSAYPAYGAYSAHFSPLAGIDIAASRVDLRSAATSILADEVAKGFAEVGFEVDVQQRVTESDAGTALVSSAGADDLVVVGPRGHGVIASVLLGSTSQYVASHAPCPVVVVRASTP